MKKLLALAVLASIPACLFAGNITIWNPLGLGNVNDLTTTSSTRNYPLGVEVVIYDDAVKSVKKYKYVYAHTTLSQYGVYQINYSSNSAQEVRSMTPSSLYLEEFGVAPATFTAGYYGFLQTYGNAVISVASNTTAGYALTLTNGLASSSSTVSGATITTNTIAIAQTTTNYSASYPTAPVMLIGGRVTAY